MVMTHHTAKANLEKGASWPPEAIPYGVPLMVDLVRADELIWKSSKINSTKKRALRVSALRADGVQLGVDF